MRTFSCSSLFKGFLRVLMLELWMNVGNKKSLQGQKYKCVYVCVCWDNGSLFACRQRCGNARRFLRGQKRLISFCQLLAVLVFTSWKHWEAKHQFTSSSFQGLNKGLNWVDTWITGSVFSAYYTESLKCHISLNVKNSSSVCFDSKSYFLISTQESKSKRSPDRHDKNSWFIL